MQAYKIDVRYMTEQEKKDVQNAFFKMGYRWYGNSDKYTQLSAISYYAYLNRSLTADGVDGHNDYKDYVNYFNEHQNTEITYTELMTLAYGEDMMNTQTKEFTKADLKDGMVVKLRGGSYNADKYKGLMLVVGESLQQATEHERLDNYLDDLKSEFYEVLDIVEVFEVISTGCPLNQIQDWALRSIWKRSEQTQQQKQLAELKAAQEQLLLQAREIADKIDALQQG